MAHMEMEHYQDALDDDNFLAEISQYFPPDTSVEKMMEVYSNPELFEQYMQQLEQYYTEAQNNYSVYQECALPVLSQSVSHTWHILLFCLLLRLLCQFKPNKYLVHCTSLVFGVLCLWKFYKADMIYTILPTILFSPFFHVRKVRKGLILCAATTVYLVACEFYILDAIKWNKLKGSVMIIMMKLIAVVFDIDNGRADIPSGYIELFGYLLNPASIIFGPFITYKDYTQLLKSYPITLLWFVNCLKVVSLSGICLVWSSCGPSNYLRMLSTYFPSLEDSKWWQAYQDAQSFRFSHYYVSYFSASACLISGITTEVPQSKDVKDASSVTDGKENDEDGTENKLIPTWTYPVANILPVELPGSLVDVVTNWNLPMHYWLKTYIYKSARGRGMFVAVLATYIASSILHGMNVQLSAVLLTIGIFAYVEGFIRHILATIFSACIEARPCRSNCSHVNSRGSFWVMAVNLLLSFVAMWNLAYLGCMFDNSPEEEAGYSWLHIHKKWMSFGYVNHAVMFGVFAALRLVNTGKVV